MANSEAEGLARLQRDLRTYGTEYVKATGSGQANRAAEIAAYVKRMQAKAGASTGVMQTGTNGAGKLPGIIAGAAGGYITGGVPGAIAAGAGAAVSGTQMTGLGIKVPGAWIPFVGPGEPEPIASMVKRYWSTTYNNFYLLNYPRNIVIYWSRKTQAWGWYRIQVPIVLSRSPRLKDLLTAAKVVDNHFIKVESRMKKYKARTSKKRR